MSVLQDVIFDIITSQKRHVDVGFSKNYSLQKEVVCDIKQWFYISDSLSAKL
jgi:hypothetical protein